MKKIALLVGARPNYMKIAPLYRVLHQEPGVWRPFLVHSGQHYDEKMSKVFFEDLELPKPDVFLGVGSGTHAEQTARVMMQLAPVLAENRPDVLIVVGDVNSTLAGALVAVKLGIPTAHVEAGLRSRDRAMPEEINRTATDAICDLLFTSCREADENLLKEGHPNERISFVGNIMIDSLAHFLPKSRESDVLARIGLTARQYICVTLHRPSNVDEPGKLLGIMQGLEDAGRETDVVFPVHPRTRKILDEAGWRKADNTRLHLLDPLGYIDFLRLMSEAAVVLTDSGGIQEETSYLGIPCLTARENTERPITITEGTNRLIKAERGEIARAIRETARAEEREAPKIEYWDGHTAERIVDVLRGWL